MIRSYPFLIAVLLVCSCSHKSEDQLFKDGQAAEGQNNFQLAVESYQEIVDRYPQGKYADTAQFRAALIYNNNLHDTGKAVAAYQRVYVKYPQSTFAPTAMFLTAFLLNNELHNFDSARAIYLAFLQKYPDHDLATSAKFELESLGKDPSQFLPHDTLAVKSQKPPIKKKAARR
ncbi:MAG: tetratricopeptide repeat protein [Bacteroidota bacterium]|jgi:TolA-binding protein